MLRTVLASAIVVLLVTSVAEAATTEVDPRTGTRFTLAGTTVKVRVADSARGRRTLAAVRGRRVRVGCIGQDLTRRGTASARARWPERSRTLRVRLPRTIVARATFCSLKLRDGSDVSAVELGAELFIDPDAHPDANLKQRNYVTLQEGRTGLVYRGDRLGRGTFLFMVVPGTYHVSAFQRPCFPGDCSRLGPPGPTCQGTVRVRRGGFVHLEEDIGPAPGCTIRPENDPD